MTVKSGFCNEMKVLQQIFFWIWLSALGFFSALTVHQNIQEHPWQSSLSSNVLVVAVCVGFIAFTLNSLLGFILRIRKIEHFNFSVFSYLISVVWIILFIGGILVWSPATKNRDQQSNVSFDSAQTVFSDVLIPTLTPKPTLKPKPVDPYANDPALKDAKWGEAVQVREHEYRMKIGEDAVMGTPQEIFEALNHYRSTKGVGRLEWNEKIAALARERVLEVTVEKTPHEGFNRRTNEDGFWEEYQINGAGENASYGYRFSGTHLIEWMYASDAGHESNQLNPQWNCVGIAVSGESSVLIFCNK
jgi:uncharacterized protein YkwD